MGKAVKCEVGSRVRRGELARGTFCSTVGRFVDRDARCAQQLRSFPRLFTSPLLLLLWGESRPRKFLRDLQVPRAIPRRFIVRFK